jgi:hypothetical protein
MRVMEQKRVALKSDYGRIEIPEIADSECQDIPLKSDYGRIEMIIWLHLE